jgi:hypothetical protein
MGILSGKYHSSDDCGPPDARMNLFRGIIFYTLHRFITWFLYSFMFPLHVSNVPSL